MSWKDVVLTVGEQELTLQQASEKFGLCSRETIQNRRKKGWTDERSVLTPSRMEAKRIETDYYGLHLMIDLFDCDYSAIATIDVIAKFLAECPSEVGMTRISPPFVFKYSEMPDQEWGVTGVVILSTSHVSAHSYPEKGYISLDVFSCRCFDPSIVLDKARSVFGGSKAAIHIVKRGKDFPRGK